MISLSVSFWIKSFCFREFSYEAGNKCDPNQVNEDELEEDLRPLSPQKKSPVPTGLSRQQQVQSQIQYRPQLSQY